MTILLGMPPLEYEQQRGKTAREAILDAVERMEEAEIRPTTRAIAAEVGLSKSTISEHVSVLIEQGWLRTVTGRSGGIYMTDAGRQARGD